MAARKWTPEQKREHAERMTAYWESHPHPKEGQAMRAETKELQREIQNRNRWEQKGHCKRCGGPLFSDKSADLGYGPDCLARAIAEGEVAYDPYERKVTELTSAKESGHYHPCCGCSSCSPTPGAELFVPNSEQGT